MNNQKQMVWIKRNSNESIQEFTIGEIDWEYAWNILRWIESKPNILQWFGFSSEEWIIALKQRINQLKQQSLKNKERVKKLKERENLIIKISDLIVNDILFNKENKFTFCKLLIKENNSMLSKVEDTL